MTTLTFDTHSFVKNLTGVGIKEEQAEVIVDGIKDINTANLIGLATKQDLLDMESHFDQKLASLESRIDQKFASLDKSYLAGENRNLQRLIAVAGVIVAAQSMIYGFMS